jgi:hypothetical protein
MNSKIKTTKTIEHFTPVAITQEDRRLALKNDAAGIAQKIRQKLGELVECAQDIANFYVASVKDCPELDQELKALLPEIPASLWARLDLIGHGVLIPELLLGYANATPYLKRLPPMEQIRCINAPVEVLIKTDHGLDTLMIAVKNMDPATCKQVFDYDHIRPAEEQRVIVEQEAKLKRTEGNGYYISPDGFLIVTRPGIRFSLDDLQLQIKIIQLTQKSGA